MVTHIRFDNKNNKGNLMKEPVIHLNVPLLLRLLEFAREESRSDMDLHFVVENVVKLNRKTDYLTMKDYSDIMEE